MNQMKVDPLGARKFICFHTRLSKLGDPPQWRLQYVTVARAQKHNNGMRKVYARMAQQWEGEKHVYLQRDARTLPDGVDVKARSQSVSAGADYL